MVSVDVDADRTDLAWRNLLDVGLEERAELRTEDAAETLARSGDAAWEFVFLDAERPAYPGYLPDLIRTLAPGALLAVDNVRSHEHELVEFTSLIEAEPALTQTVVPVGAGLRLAVRDRRRVNGEHLENGDGYRRERSQDPESSCITRQRSDFVGTVPY